MGKIRGNIILKNDSKSKSVNNYIAIFSSYVNESNSMSVNSGREGIICDYKDRKTVN